MVPVRHTVHPMLPVPLAKVPEEQGRHSEVPVSFAKRPGGQEWQKAQDALLLNLPEEHALHWPVSFRNQPFAQPVWHAIPTCPEQGQIIFLLFARLG